MLNKEQRDELIFKYLERKEKGFERGELAEFHREMSEEYNVDFEYVKSFYYRFVKNKTLKDFKSDKNQFKKGDFVPVVVARVVDYGAVVQTKTPFPVKGLIHISNGGDFYISNIHDYFYEGQEVEAEILNFNEKEQYLSLSSQHLNLSPLPANFDPTTYKKEPVKKVVSVPDPAPASLKKTLDESKPEPNRDFLMIQSYLEKNLGSLSDEAKEKLDSLTDDHGFVSSTIAIQDHLQEFSYDPSLIFLKQVEEKISQYL